MAAVAVAAATIMAELNFESTPAMRSVTLRINDVSPISSFLPFRRVSRSAGRKQLYSLYHGIVNAVQIFGVVNNIFTKGGDIKKSRRPCGGMRDFVGSDYFFFFFTTAATQGIGAASATCSPPSIISPKDKALRQGISDLRTGFRS